MKISYTQLVDFLNCKRMYYLKHVLKLRSKVLNIPYIIGSLAHEAILDLLQTKDLRHTLDIYLQKYNKKVKDLRKSKNIILTDEDYNELYNYEFILKGMIEGYMFKNKSFVNSVKLLSNKSVKANINNAIIFAYPDNLIELNNTVMVYELKTVSKLTSDYIINIKGNFQVNLEMFLFNFSKKESVSSIYYDIIKKCQYRLKRNESVIEFRNRLHDYYLDESEPNFYQEIFVNKHLQKIFLTLLTNIVNDFKLCGDNIDKYYYNFNYCFVWQRCEFYEICHKGFTKQIKLNFIQVK